MNLCPSGLEHMTNDSAVRCAVRSPSLTVRRNIRKRRPTVLSFRHIQGSLGQRHDIYPQAWESDCGTYEKTTESRARAERWEHPGDRLRDRRFPAPPR